MKQSKKIAYLVFSLLIISIVGVNCSKSNADSTTVKNTCDPNISFANTIKPILDHNCNFSGCHDDQVITALNTFQTVHDGAAQIKLSILTGKMPRNRTMTIADKNAIYCWVDNGAKNN
mgnify:FL=1